MGGLIMASTINADTTNGVVVTSDTSGEIELQSAGVTKAKVTANGLQDANGNSLRGGMYRNLIINGDMRIDQRNAGGAVTAGNAYPVDRWYISNTANGSYSAQQVSDTPVGFSSSLKVTVTAAQTANIGNLAPVQIIEGNNISHLDWGTSDAKSVTLSFWVRSSLTGTFGGSLRNSSSNRSYPFTYTISVADTWEYKTITIAGDTSGTWLTTNGVGIRVRFSLYAVASSLQSAGTWYAGSATGATGQTQLASTNGATFYITGVQLEVGEGASDFEFLPYDVQLARCQRYFQTIGSFQAATITTNQTVVVGCYSMYCPMRADPSLYTFNGSFHKPGIAFYTISSFSSIQNYQGNSYTTFNIASGAGSGVDGNYNGTLQIQAEL